MTSHGRLDPAELLEHAGWARSLAAHLVRDGASADDLVQETWLAAIRRPPRTDRPVRPWLAAVMRRLALRRRRDDGRRARRDAAAGEAAARGEAPPAEDVVSAMEAHRRLGDAVESLPEPFRTAIYLRYYEGLDGNELAERTSVPPGTARWRVSRGLELLRERLDETTPGGRSAWCAAFVALDACDGGAGTAADPGTGAAAAGVPASWLAAAGALLMATWTKAAVGVVVLAAAGGAAWLASRPSGEDPASASALADTGDDPAPRALGPARRARAVGAAAPAESAVAVGGSPDAAAERARSPAADGPLVRGRIASDDDVPLPGAHVEIADGDLRASSVSDTGGVCELRLVRADAPRTVVLTVLADGFATAFRQIDVPGAGEVDVGVLRLSPGGSAEGVVVDGDGRPVPRAEVGVADPTIRDRELEGARREPTGVALLAPRTSADDAGRFLLRGVPAGPVRLWAHAPGWYGGASGTIDVLPARRTVGVRIAIEEPPASEVVSGVVLGTDGLPLPGATIRYSWTAGGVSGTATRSADAEGRFVLLLGEGVVHAITASEPGGRLQSATLAAVRTGSAPVTLRIGDVKSTVLRVESVGGAPIERFGWSVVGDGETALAWAPREERAGGEATVVLPSVPARFVVDAPGHELARSEPIDPGAPPPRVTVVLQPLPGLRGVVVVGDAGVPGAAVALVRAFGDDEFVEVNRAPARCDFQAHEESTCGAGGDFALTVRTAGRWFVRAEAPGFAPGLAGPFDVDPRAGLADVRIPLRRPGAIEGNVLVDAGRRADAVIVSLTCFDGRPRTVRPDAEGRFRADGLAPGPWLVAETQHEIHAGETMMTRRSGRPEFAGNCDVPEGGAARVTLDLREESKLHLRLDVRVDGRPAAEWTVDVLREPAPFAATESSGRLDADGRMRVAVRAARPTGLRLQSPAGVGTFVPADLSASLDASLRLVTGRVEVSGLTPSVRATHLLVSVGAGGVVGVAEVKGDEQGRCAIDGLVAGRVRLVAPGAVDPTLSPAEWPALKEGDLAAGETLRL